ncbi:MAG TPA: PQQ-binding-like beta-propeller repeat protein [Thermoanaerobaculia bacterium]|nr:PQQ-binding-like beta-propeller repeat protein [Thermoanaerobaculia bacterium]
MKSTYVSASTVCLATALVLLASTAPAAYGQSFDWMQFGFDSRHSGASPQETTIHTANVATLHTKYPAVALGNIAAGAPAFLSGVSTAGGVKDLLFLTTQDGHILALDAATGSTVWSKQPATSPRYTTSSPAVDPNRQFVYSYGLEGKVHKYQVGDGSEITTGGWPELATLKPSVEKGSSALAIATSTGGTTYLYVSNGGYPGDAGDYQGHVTAINLATGTQNVFNTDCSDQAVHFTTGGSPDCTHMQSAVWARPGVVYDPDNDKIFFGTGNGDYDANNPGKFDWGDSILALHPDGTGNGAGGPVDSYTPTEFQTLQNTDADLGSTAPAILPTPAASKFAHLAVQGGKDGLLRLLNLDDLSGMGGPGHTAGEIQKFSAPQGVSGMLTFPAVWVNPADGSTWVFETNFSGIAGLKLTVDGSGNPSLVSQWSQGPGGTSPIVANGILYYASSGTIHGLDPITGTQLWSAAIGSIHWQSPVVVNGTLYITDESSKLNAFVPNAAPLNFFTVTPCRLVDTRGPAGPYGGPALQGGGAKRLFTVAGQCGVPADALAIAANLTVVGPTNPGFLQAGPSGTSLVASNLNFNAGQTRASNAILSLTGYPVGAAQVTSNISGGTTHFILDVSGYFK